MAFPPNVAANELIESAWGNAVVDTLKRVRTPNVLNPTGSTALQDPEGMMQFAAGFHAGVALSGGDATLVFAGGVAFASAPVVVPIIGNPPATGLMIGVYSVTTTNFRVHVNAHDGTAFAGPVTISYIAIGRRSVA